MLGGAIMGRKIVCESCGTEFKFEVAKDFEKCPVCGVTFDNENDTQEGWITWYYYGFKKCSGGSLMNKPMDLERFGDTHYLIKEFKAPPKDENGNCEAAKRELRKYVPDAFAPPKENPIRCPRCGSTEYTLMNRGFSIWTGFLGSGKAKRICNRCKREF